MLKNIGEEIRDPKQNQVVFYQPWQGETDKRKKPYPVIINSGCFLDPTFGSLSNFWYWQKLTPTGRIKPEIEQGYGNFFIAEGYEVQRKIIIKK